MNKQFSTLHISVLLHCFYLGFYFLFPSPLSAQSNLNFDQIAQKNNTPNWITVKSTLSLSPDAILQRANASNDFTYELLEITNDKIGLEHQRFQQKYKGYPVEGSQILFHGKTGNVRHLNHSLADISQNNSSIVGLTEAEALSRLLDGIGAETYAWESVDFENQLKIIKENPTATYFPTGKLVWMTKTNSEDYRLTYRFDVYATAPLSRKFYYVDSETGELVNSIDRITTSCFSAPSNTEDNNIFSTSNHSHSSTTDIAASGICSYVSANNSVVNFTSQSNGGQYILKADNLGGSNTQIIHTVNANNQSSSNNLTEFIDSDNYWENNSVAVSVHWGTTETFNYFEQYHNRNSYDNNGAQLFSRVHYSNNYANAFWDGTQMTYGDGDGTNYSALTSLDVVSHEITHAVTQYNSTGGLIYQNESGALNESFSDIFGAVVEFTAHPDGGDWLMGEDFDLINGVGFRNMENPNLKNHPKTYGGLHWYAGSGDSGGVHSNSGVQNHWFYLLTTGGSGTNEYGINYNISPINMQHGAQIAYRNLTTYLTPNASYPDAVNGSIQAAIDLFGVNSAQHIAVQQAWCAVGLGFGCYPTITIQRPISNETLIAGTNYMIQWSSNMLTSTSGVKIEYTTDLGPNENWIEIVENTINSGNFNWFVPNVVSSSVRIRIRDKGDDTTNRPANPIVLDISEPFTIQPCLGNPSFSYSSPVVVNESVFFTGLITGTSYEWSIDGTIIGNAKDLYYVFPNAGYYTLRYTVPSAGGCVNIEEQIVAVLSENANGFSNQIGNYDNNQYARTQEVFQAKNGDYLLLTNGESILSCYDYQGNKKWASGAFTGYPSAIQQLKRKKEEWQFFKNKA